MFDLCMSYDYGFESPFVLVDKWSTYVYVLVRGKNIST